jgi:disulfide bond formation protein DsbB
MRDMSAPTPERRAVWTYAAFAAALVTALGSLYLSYVMELVACPLCFYQRTFALGALGVLAMGLLTGAGRSAPLAALALPLAAGGLSIAVFHARLEMMGRMECPGGVLDLGSAPQQSLAAFTLLTALLVIDLLSAGGAARLAALVGGLALGVLFAAGCIATSSPPCPVKPEEYASPPKGCRPPQPKQP